MINPPNLHWCENLDSPEWVAWDDFLQETPRGHYLQLSDWLKAYSIYGFKAVLLIGKDEIGNIVGGLGVVKAEIAFIKLFIVPAGPIIREGWEDTTEVFIREFYDYCKKSGATYAHINVPMLEQGEMPFSLPLNALPKSSIFYSGKEGIRFKNVATISGLRWVDLQEYDLEKQEVLLAALPAKTRRDIRASQRKEVYCYEVRELDQIKQAYSFIEISAKENGYVVRSWNDIADLIRNSTTKAYSTFFVANKNGEQKGAIWLIKCGKRYTYMTGGTKRETPDLLTGYILQWNALILSLREGFKGYDISVGGTSGVLQFKDSFGPTYYTFVSPRYWVFKPLQFNIFNVFYNKLSRHKKAIATFLRLWQKNVR